MGLSSWGQLRLRISAALCFSVPAKMTGQATGAGRLLKHPNCAAADGKNKKESVHAMFPAQRVQCPVSWSAGWCHVEPVPVPRAGDWQNPPLERVRVHPLSVRQNWALGWALPPRGQFPLFFLTISVPPDKAGSQCKEASGQRQGRDPDSLCKRC